MRRDRRHIQRWASWVLFTWLFGLAMGLVNACALVDRAHAPAAHGESQPVDRHAGQGDEEPGHDKSNCLDFCALSSIATPILKTSVDLPQAADLPALVPACLLQPASMEAGHRAAPSPLFERRRDPPLRIAYQRLAL